MISNPRYIKWRCLATSRFSTRRYKTHLILTFSQSTRRWGTRDFNVLAVIKDGADQLEIVN
ncbi:MAG: hypothetical protein V7K50_07885 [Nostoc sp.]|uniref:hypothetical protein n=1 Tax=Nostoc sp. TaxID=1180 RepID=UPI002FF99BB0